MPGRRMDTRTIREIPRLKSRNLSAAKISRSVDKAGSSVNDIVRKAASADLQWSVLKDIDDRKLEEMLCPKPEVVAGAKALPDFTGVHGELKRKGVTRQLLWKEYAEAHPDSHYSCPRFRKLCGAWRGKNRQPLTRQARKAGEKCFADYAGQTVNITDSTTGEATGAQVFVGVMGASNCVFAEAAASRTLPDWLGSRTRMLEFFGAVPEIIVPDNLRGGAVKACRRDPDTNPAYQQWASNCRTVIIPARPYKPRDKAKVEVGVQIVERSVPAPLRDEVFFSLSQLNIRVKKLAAEANSKPFRKLEGARREEFERADLPAMGPLPPYPCTYTGIKRAKVNIDCRVEYKKALYSVPWTYRGERVDIRAAENIVMIYFKNKLIAQHKRLKPGRCSTEPAHMPEGHGEHERRNPRRLRNWAKDLGEEVLERVNTQIESKDRPEQACRACPGLMSLSRDCPRRLNDARGAADRNGLAKLRQVREALKNGMDTLALFEEDPSELPQDHENIRGPEQFG